MDGSGEIPMDPVEEPESPELDKKDNLAVKRSGDDDGDAEETTKRRRLGYFGHAEGICHLLNLNIDFDSAVAWLNAWNC